MTSRARFLAALHCRPLDRPPVWIMRQAGRYLPEYRALKTKHTFVEMVRTPELAAEVTLQPLRRFPGLDAAIIFSDILVIPEALGQPYHFREEGGIGMEFAVRTAQQIEALDASAIRERLDYVARALRLVHTALDGRQALLGFAGAPWTLAAYMVEGGSSDDFAHLKALALGEPALFERLMEKITAAVTEYLLMQAECGVDAVQLFDSWAAACPGADYERFSLRYIRRIVERVGARLPVIVFPRGAGTHLAAIAATGARAVGIDWTTDLATARAAVPASTALQGNLDPVVLNLTPEITRRETRRVLDAMAGRPGHIFNLGHGITPAAQIENVAALLAEVHAPSPAPAP